MTHRVLSAVAAVILFTIPSLAQPWRLVVRNAAPESRDREPVVVRLDGSVQQKLTGAGVLQVTRTDGAVLDCQADDTDGDGRPDEIVFIDSFGPREPRSYTLSTAKGQGARPAGRPALAASIWKWQGKRQVRQDADTIIAPGTRGRYRFDGVGWESETVGYRLYLDERNAVDVLSKRQPGLYWDRIGGSDIDYQADNSWGMDVLHIGGALGVGGIAVWEGDTLARPRRVDNWTCTIVASGPVRSVVRVTYRGWQTAIGKVDLSSLFVMYPGERLCEHRVVPAGSPTAVQIAAGLVRHPAAPAEWNQREGWVSTIGPQSRVPDTLLLALIFPTDRPFTTLDDSLDYLVVFPLGSGVRFWIASAWQGEPGGLIGPAERDAVLRRAALRLRSPLDAALDF
jgi:hypothetical protein